MKLSHHLYGALLLVIAAVSYQNCSPVHFSDVINTSVCDDDAAFIYSDHMQGNVTVLRVNQPGTFGLDGCANAMADWDMEADGSIDIEASAGGTHTYLSVGTYEVLAHTIQADGSAGPVVSHQVNVIAEFDDCATPNPNVRVPHGQRRTLYKSTSTCGQNCSPETRLCLNGKLYKEPNTTTENPFPSTHTLTSCNSPACPAGCTLRFTDNTNRTMANAEVYPPLATPSSYVYSGETVPVGQTCSGFKVVCNNGTIKRYATDVVISQPVAKSCCSQQDLNQTLESMKEIKTVTNRAVSNTCKDGWLNSYYANCGSHFTLDEASFIGINYNGSCSRVYQEAMRVRFVNTCANRYCNQAGADAGMMNSSIAISNPTAILNTHLNQSAVVNCIKQVAPPTAPQACQQIINLRKIIENKVTTHSIITSRCNRAWSPTLDFAMACGKAYCQSLNEGFVEGRIIEHSNGNVTTQCFRDQSSYSDMFN